MLKDLQKKTRGKEIVNAVIAGILFLIFFLVWFFGLRDYLKPVYNLNKMDEFDIKSGAKVEGDITLIYGCYCYEEMTYEDSPESNYISSKEYYIPVGEKIIGLKCLNDADIANADYNLDLILSYYEGADVTSDDLKTIHLEGYINELWGDSLQFYNEGISDFGEENRDMFMPYYMTIDAHTSFNGLIVRSVLAVLALLLFLFYIMRSINPPIPKAIKAYIAQVGDKDRAWAKLENFYNTATVIHGVRFTQDLLYGVHSGKVVLVDPKQILWIYPHYTNLRYNFIPVVVDYSVYLCTHDRKVLKIGAGSERKAEEIINKLHQMMPYIFYGYRDDIKKLYQKDIGKMIESKEACRARYLVETGGGQIMNAGQW